MKPALFVAAIAIAACGAAGCSASGATGGRSGVLPVAATVSSQSVAHTSSTGPSARSNRSRYFVSVSPERDRAGSSVLLVSRLSGGARQLTHSYLYLSRTGSAMRAVHLPRAARRKPMLTAEAFDTRHLWVITGACWDLRATLWRTSDGGRHWRQSQVAGPNCAGGSTDYLDFTDPRHGLLTSTIANASDADLYRTADGGRRWARVASMKSARDPLPIDGPVQQLGDGALWLTGSTCSSRTWTSAGVGAPWRRVDLPGVRRERYRPASVLGNVIVQPVTTRAGCRTPVRLRLYRSTDSGRTWARLSLNLPGPPSTEAHDTITAVSATRFWLVQFSPRGDRLYESDDAGRHWRPRNYR